MLLMVADTLLSRNGTTSIFFSLISVKYKFVAFFNKPFKASLAFLKPPHKSLTANPISPLAWEPMLAFKDSRRNIPQMEEESPVQSPRGGTWGCPLHSQAEQSHSSQGWAGSMPGSGARRGAGVGSGWLLGVYLELGDHGCASGLTPVSCSAASSARADSSPTGYLCLPPPAPLPPSFHCPDNSHFTSPFCFLASFK